MTTKEAEKVMLTFVNPFGTKNQNYYKNRYWHASRIFYGHDFFEGEFVKREGSEIPYRLAFNCFDDKYLLNRCSKLSLEEQEEWIKNH